MVEKCFTIETRLEKSQFDILYFEKNLEKQNRIFRTVWKMIQTSSLSQSQMNTYLQKTYHIDKRTANSLIKNAKGRLKALKELKKVEYESLKEKKSKLEKQIDELSIKLDQLKEKVTENKARPSELGRYRTYKKIIWQKKQKLNRFNQKLSNYKNNDNCQCMNICWGSKKLFKAQYYLEENGFKSHEGWINAYRKKRDSQVNYIGSIGEPKGNQNCQLTYNLSDDNFALRIRKDLEFMKDEKDKFFTIEGLDFLYLKDKLVEVLKENKTPLTFRILRRKSKWYVQVVFTWLFDEEKGYKSHAETGSIGLDFNDGFIECSEIDHFGNLVGQYHYPLQYHGTGNKADTEIQQAIAEITELAKKKEKPIIIENLNFKKAKAGTYKSKNRKGNQYNKMIHAFDYSRYKKRMENACYRNGIELIKVNPAYTSKIGIKKYGERMKLNKHQAASYVIARKGIGFKDKSVK